MGFWPVVLNVLKNADVVLLLIDARIPEISQNQEIINKIERMKKKRLLLIFNKCDLISKQLLHKLKQQHPNAHFISSLKTTGINNLKTTLFNMADNFDKPTLKIGIVGYPNVGKSTLINKLAPQAQAKVSPISGTTKKTQWIRTKNLRIMDSPGVIPFSDNKTKLGITSAKDPHKIKNVEKVAYQLIEQLDQQHPQTLNKFYNVNNQLTGYELLLAIGKKKGYLQKKGAINEHRTAITLLEDWQKGKISLQ